VCSLGDLNPRRVEDLATRKLQYLAEHDALTQLPNRRGVYGASTGPVGLLECVRRGLFPNKGWRKIL
jgi:hypothetical protein